MLPGICIPGFKVVPPEADVTWNPSDKGADVVLSNGNLDAASTAAAPWTGTGVRATVGRSAGKRYFEVYVVSNTSPDTSMHGLAKADWSLNSYPGNTATSLGTRQVADAYVSGGGVSHVGGAGFGGSDSAGVTIMWALDLDAGKVWHGRNGTWRNSGNPGAGTGNSFAIPAGPWFPGMAIYGASYGTYRLRTKLADFVYPPPSSFVSWATP